MHIEKSESMSRCDIWIDKAHSHDYKQSSRYKAAVEESKAAGYDVCVYIGGELPLLPVIDEMLMPNPIVA